jgi:hypothetical protein
LPKALLLIIFPDPVFLKRFAAPRFVLTFGISYLPISIHISLPRPPWKAGAQYSRLQ